MRAQVVVVIAAACLLPITSSFHQVAQDGEISDPNRWFFCSAMRTLTTFCRRIDSFLDSTGKDIITAAGSNVTSASLVVSFLNSVCNNARRIEEGANEEVERFFCPNVLNIVCGRISSFLSATAPSGTDAANFTVTNVIAGAFSGVCSNSRIDNTPVDDDNELSPAMIETMYEDKIRDFLLPPAEAEGMVAPQRAEAENRLGPRKEKDPRGV